MNNSSSTTNRIVWVDLIRSISIFLVIVIHTTSPVLPAWGKIPLFNWMTGNVYDSLARVSVPLLFMTSGYLLLSRQESISTFYLKRFWKVLLPFLVWAIFYLLIESRGYKGFTFFNAVKAIIYAILTQNVEFHLWFLYELLAIYLFVPLIRVFLQSAQRVHLWYFAGVWILFGPVKDIIEHATGLQFAFNLGFFTSYIGFFVIGYLLGNLEFSQKSILASAFVFLFAGAYTIYATYALTLQAGDYVQYFYWYTRINIVLMSFAAFILLKETGKVIKNHAVIVWFQRFAQASFGIYLVHVFVLQELKWAGGLDVTAGPAWMIVPAIAISVTLISWGIIAILQQIPILRELAPK